MKIDRRVSYPHPEAEPGEVFVRNYSQQAFNNLPLKSKRRREGARGKDACGLAARHGRKFEPRYEAARIDASGA